MRIPKLKSVAFIVLATLFTSSALVSTRSAHAFVAGATAGSAIPGLVVVGAGLLAVGGGAAVLFSSDGSSPGSSAEGVLIESALLGVPGVIAALVGIILLDEKGQVSAKYVPLTSKQAIQAGLSAAELKAYSDDLDTINAVAELVASDLADSQQLTLSYSQAQWKIHAQEFGADRSPELRDAFSAAQKTSLFSIKRLAAESRSK